MIKVLVADDHPPVRAGIVHQLAHEPDIQVVAEVSNGPELYATLARIETPTVVLLDIRMPDFDAIESVPDLRSKYPAMKILIVTAHDDRKNIRDLLDLGVEGYLLKGELLKIYPVAVREIAAGRTFYSQRVTNVWFADRNRKPVRLSRREAEVLQLVSDGATSGEIGRELSISAKTVDTHVERICRKLGATNRPEAVARGYELGLIKPKGEDHDDDSR